MNASWWNTRFPGFEVDTQQVGAQAIQILKETLPDRKYSNVTVAQ